MNKDYEEVLCGPNSSWLDLRLIRMIIKCFYTGHERRAS